MHLKQALSNIKQHVLRSFLTLLGVLVGTAAIVALLTGSELATESALNQFKKLGTDIISVSISDTNTNNSHSANSFSTTEIKKISSANILSGTPYTLHYSQMVYKDKQSGLSIIGVSQFLQTLMHQKILYGRYISDLDKSAFYCVLGNDIANLLSKDKTTLIGDQVKIENFYFTIIGVLDEADKNLFLLTDTNQSILIPLNTSMSLYKNASISNVIFKLKTEKNIKEVQEQITNYFKSVHPDMQVNFRSPETIIENMQKQNKIFKLLLGFIGGIALLVGGIGVMNIMLVSVTERRREIGIRMAVGAQKKDILYLFLAEAAILTFIGGFAGIILGEMIGYVTAKFSHWDYHFVLGPILIGFLVSVFVGLFFGYYPAQKASQSDPIEILRFS